jgi:amidase
MPDLGRRDVAGLRIVAFTDNGLRTPTPATVATVEAAVTALGDAGAVIRREVPPGLDAAWRAWDAMIRADGWAWLQRLITAAGTPGMGSYATRDWLAPSVALSGAALTELLERADAIRAAFRRWTTDVDAIVCPVMPQAAIRHGESSAAWFGDTYSDVHNLTGLPGVVVRGGSTDEGLPIGVQLLAPLWREDLALAAARVVEAASGGWQRPPI